ncbi:MAG TPA: hypothetical protein VGN46_16545 [Luteibacter sp.]|jgi:hypothetical protein|uniref:hypothetical protein n=1 Tax=Luteibacter sp. TaxID=1886636 RepID=UPI002F3F9E57
MGSKHANWKRLANIAGGILGIAGIAFLVAQLRRYGAAMDLKGLSSNDWLAFACLSLLGICMNACLGLAWRAVLAWNAVRVDARWAIATYAITHVARYVPGNIFHYAGRQAVGMAAGLPARALARASFMELAMVASCGALLGLFAAPLVIPELDALWWRLTAMILVIVTLGVVFRLGGRRLAEALALYTAYLVMSGLTFLAFIALRGSFQTFQSQDVVAFGAAYIVAWLIGMLAPGAPAGLGVREAVVLFFLRGSVDAAILLFAVLGTRITSVCADALACALGLFLRRLPGGAAA